MKFSFLIDGVRVYGSMVHHEFQPCDEYEIVNWSEMYAALREDGQFIEGERNADFSTWAEWVESSGRLDDAAHLHLDHIHGEDTCECD
jgi:hypothetical protein